jgi:hypothetical protein
VPGLAAKPVIDCDIVVAGQDVAAASRALTGLGFQPLGELGIPLNTAARRAPWSRRFSPPRPGTPKRGLAGVAHVDSYLQSLGAEICLILPPSERTCRRLSQDVASREILRNRKVINTKSAR